MQRQEIGNTQQAFGAVMIGCALRLFGSQFFPVVIMHFHIEPARFGGKSLPHAAHPDDTKPRACHLFSYHKGR